MRCLALFLALSASLSTLAAVATTVPVDMPIQQRIAAAQATARTAASCIPIQPFYWEIGDAQGPLTGGSVGRDAPRRDTPMAIASASKWIYAAYVAERRQGELTADDISFLSFESGYTRFRICQQWQTVASCLASPINGFGAQDPSTAHRFDYNGGHMQKHAALMGLGPQGNEALGMSIRSGLSPLGPDWSFQYTQPQPAGGGATSAADYAHFLRAAMRGDLQIGKLLGTHAVCTNPTTCPDQAVHTPVPETESWHYSIGHWVEDDPLVGDGSFSSAGAFGFYPWINADKQYYGVLARVDRQGVLAGNQADSATADPMNDQRGSKQGAQSVDCGRLIRAAWIQGQAKQ